MCGGATTVAAASTCSSSASPFCEHAGGEGVLMVQREKLPAFLRVPLILVAFMSVVTIVSFMFKTELLPQYGGGRTLRMIVHSSSHVNPLQHQFIRASNGITKATATHPSPIHPKRNVRLDKDEVKTQRIEMALLNFLLPFTGNFYGTRCTLLHGLLQ